MVDLLNQNRLYLQEDYRGYFCEADAEAQKVFVQMIKERFRAKEERAISTIITLTAHFRLTTRVPLMHWSRRAKVWSSPLWAVRTQVNINGLLNAYDVIDVIAHECPSVNVDSTIAFYEAALEKHPETESIYIITDNTRYYLSKKLWEWVEGAKIKQIFLPPILRI